ncbi:hypothetical protein [Oceanobacillus senegalensis]|uniref:hypothetical protein n=1 Tax=Oceanobacillus senegalensis TaxID=1936063 RepID=UPI000A3067C9|nr:hypothetical protein [Oceanobacillus senegalensis]
MDQNIQQKLNQASQNIKQAQDSVLQAQGRDQQLLQQAQQNLQQAEDELNNLQNQMGKELTENPQFQQAFESLHDTRQQVSEATQNINDTL